MRKRVAFRALVILLASALLLTSTGAYNILVFADQNMESSSLSATDESAASAPSVTTHGGEMVDENISIATQAAVTWNGLGTQQSPYEIGDIAHLLDAYNKINNIASADKYFVLTNDIDITALTIDDFHDSALGSAAYLLSAEGSNPSSVYFKLDGNNHRIYTSNVNSMIDASGYQYFGLFGFMNGNCEVKNLSIENIRVSLMNARSASIVAFKNSGTIENVTVVGCTMNVSGSTSEESTDSAFSNLDGNGNTGNDIYHGFSAVAADNRGIVRNVSVECYRVSVNNDSNYVGGVVAQNRGTVTGGTVSRLKMTTTAANAYIGGLCGVNDEDSTVSNCMVYLGGQDDDGQEKWTNNIYGGRYVGGLVGKNDGALTNSLVSGSFGTISKPSAESYDMCAVIRSDDASNAVPYYYGGAVAGGNGTIAQVTVQNIGFYMSLISTDTPCYFGGVTATAHSANSVVGCIATGSFVSSAYSSVCYAGGVLAYAPSDAQASTLVKCYTLFRIDNVGHYLSGAVVGFGGNAGMMTNCYWSSEISGCITAYAIPNVSDSSIIEEISDRSKDLSVSERAVVARRNTSLNLAEPTHGWDGAAASFSHSDDTTLSHTVQGVVNSLDAVPYQQTMALTDATIGYSGLRSFAVAFKWDVFIVAADNIGDPNDSSDPFQISSSGMLRFLYLAPYGNYVLTQDVTIDENEWQEVAFYGQLSGCFNGVTHTIYAPRRIFSAVIGSRSTGVEVDETNYTTNPASVSAQGGSVKQVNVNLTPDYFVLEANSYAKSIFGSLFSATVCYVSLTNETSESALLSGSRQGVFADAAYRNTYVYGCSSDISVHYAGSGTDVGTFIGYLDSSNNVIDNCIIDADVVKDYSASNVAGFIGDIAENGGYVLNSIVITTVPDGVASIFGRVCTDAEAEQSKFRNIYWSRNGYRDTSAPVLGNYQSLDELHLWGTTNAIDLAQYYMCYHTLNSGDARVELPLPQNIEKMSDLREKDFTVTRLGSAGDTVYYQLSRTTIGGNTLQLDFSAKDDATDGSTNIFKVTYGPTGLTAYIYIVAQNSSGLHDDDGDGYLEIKSAADLKNLSDSIQDDNELMAAASFELCDDIDMSYFDGSSDARTFYPIGTISNPFTGAFIGERDNGNNLYTISNVTVTAATNVKDYTNNGLFGVVKAAENTDRENDVHESVSGLRGIEDFNIDNIRVIGGDSAGALIGSLVNNNSSTLLAVVSFPVRNICVTNSVILGGSEDVSNFGRHIGGLIGEISGTSAEISGIHMSKVRVTSYFFDAKFSDKVATRVNEFMQGYFTADYFIQTMAIGGVIGTVFSEQFENEIELNITDTHTDNLYIARESTFDSNEEAYATMDAGGIIGSALNSYSDIGYNQIRLNIGAADVSDDVTVTDTRILSYGNAGGIIGAANVIAVLTNCLVSGSDASVEPEQSAMQILSKSYYYLGGVAGYLGTSFNNINGLDTAMPSSMVYGSVVDCSVENAYVASTETTYQGYGSAPMRNVSVGGIIGGGNGQGYSPDSGEYGTAVEEGENLAPFVSGCSVDNSRIEGIVTGGIVGADAEIQYASDDETDEYHLLGWLDDSYLNYRDFITDCHVTNSQITTIANATRVAGDCQSNDTAAALVDADRFVLASGVGGIMGTNARFQYSSLVPNRDKVVLSYSYLHDTTIQYCSIDSNTTIESLLPYSNDTSTGNVAVGGVVGVAFTNELLNGYGEFGNFVVRFNEVSASLNNTAELSTSQDFNENSSSEPEIKVGTGGMIGMVKGGSNGDTNQYQYNVRCFIPGIHVYTSVFDGRLTGMHALGGVIGVVNYATDFSVTAAADSFYEGFDNGYYQWDWSEDEVPNQMIFDVAVAGSISVSSSVKSEKTGTCYGGYAVGHISAGEGAYTFNLYNESVISNTPEQIFCDIYYTSFGSDPDLLPFGFLNGDYEHKVLPLVDCPDYYQDVNLDDSGDPLFDDIDAGGNHYKVTQSIDITEGSEDRFVIMAADEPQYNWQGSNGFVADISSSSDGVRKTVDVRAQRAGTVLVSISFVGYLSDYSEEGEWSNKEVLIPCGFKYESPSQPPLTVAHNNSTGVDYRLVQSALDLSVVGYTIAGVYDGVTKEMTKTAGSMAWHYALYNEDGVIEFTEDMFASDGSFPGGMTPIGTAASPFTGSFETLPEGEYTFTSYSISYPTLGSNGVLVPSSESKTVAYDQDDFKVTLKNLQMKTTDTGIGASLFGNVSGATVKNFKIDGMELMGSPTGNYVGAIADKVFAPGTAGVAPITIENVELNHFDFSYADYVGGLVGGIFANQNNPTSNSAAAVIRNCLVGTDVSDGVTPAEGHYTNSLRAVAGVGGLIGHSSQYPTNISDCTVCDVSVIQTDESGVDGTNLDKGAAGVAMAYSGTMQDVVVEHCSIVGEVVGGAVMRSYTSKWAYDFESAGTYGSYSNSASATECASPLGADGTSENGGVWLTGIEIKDSDLVGNIATGNTESAVPYSASGGILARVDANTSNHFIDDCSVDKKTTIQAVNGVGGIVGCIESASAIDASTVFAQFGVTVTDCTMDATLSRSETAEVGQVFNRGIGGIIGVFYGNSPLIFTHISGCSVGGTIYTDGTAGGLVGSVLASALNPRVFGRNGVSSYFDLSNMDAGTHFISNCLVTTDFVNLNGDSCFTSRLRGVGVLLGYCCYDTQSSNVTIFPADSRYDYDTGSNYPFYHVMFSTANYNQEFVALFGFDSDLSAYPCLNGVEYATGYCYDVNRVGAEATTSHFEISKEGYLNPAAYTRINTETPNDSGVLEFYSTSFNKENDNTLLLSWDENAQGSITLNTAVVDENYSFGSASCVDSFTTTSNNGTENKTYSYELSAIELMDNTDKFEVAYDREDDAKSFTLALKDGVTLNDKLNLTLCFTYSNGLRMSMDIFINVRAKEYWRLDVDDSGLDNTYYLLFNASNLAELQHMSTEEDSRANARIIQCYDLFWTLSDGDVITAEKAALKNGYGDDVTIADVLGDVYIDVDGKSYTSDEIDALGLSTDSMIRLYDYLGSFKRPNPAYLEDENEEPEISFYDYFAENYSFDDCSEVPMSAVVGDIGNIDYGVYGETGSATICNPYSEDDGANVPFQGQYITLKNHSVDTAVTAADESFAIYGLELRSEHVQATGTDQQDAPYAGLFAQIGDGAIVSDVRFINPKISVINSDGTDCYAGALAGAICFTDSGSMPVIRNIRIEGTGDGNAYVKAITRMNAASVYAGGLVGLADGSITMYSASVSGVDVVASCMANAQSASDGIQTLSGGVVGEAVGSPGVDPSYFQNLDVANCGVYANRNTASIGKITSYAGGMFGVMNASVDLLDSMDPETGETCYDPETGKERLADRSEVSDTVVCGTVVTTDYNYSRNNGNNTALDIAGGVAAMSSGASGVYSVNVCGDTIVGYDVAGGIVGQIDDSETASLDITNCAVGLRKGVDPEVDPYQVVVLEQNETGVYVVGTSGTSAHFNTAGGAVGNVQNLDFLTIGSVDNSWEGVDFLGTVGTYGYDNNNREAVAGGIIGSVSGSDEVDLDTYLDKIQIYASTVQGEVRGFNRDSVTDMKCAGGAGGIIGKIACAARKSNIDNFNDNPGSWLMNDCIMSAKVYLYNSVYGSTVDCSDNLRNRNRNTNAGKLIGRMADGAIVDSDCGSVVIADWWSIIRSILNDETSSSVLQDTSSGADVPLRSGDEGRALKAALRGKLLVDGVRLNDAVVNISDYIQYVYGSSYPQDIVLYGNHNMSAVDFQTQTDLFNYMLIPVPYVDCNSMSRFIADREVDESTYGMNVGDVPTEVQTFMVSEGEAPSGALEEDPTVYSEQQYTDNAFIPLDEDDAESTTHYKYFRFFNPVVDDSDFSKTKMTFLADDINLLDSNGEPIADATAQYSADVGVTDEVYVYDFSQEPVEPTGDMFTYTYNAGVMTINFDEEKEMIGSIVLNFDYGIQMESSFTSIEIEGDGTEINPYQITQPKHFYVMRALRNNDRHFLQMNNIDLNMLESDKVLNRYTTFNGFEPIGTLASPFCGHFDGNGFVIRNLYIRDESANAAGLFGCVGRSTSLENIHIEVADALTVRDLEDVRTTVTGGIIGGNNTGGLVGIIKITGSSTATVTNCSVAGNSVVGGMNVGGLVGTSAGSTEFNNCFTSTTTASYSSVANVGAFLGSVSSGSCALNDCYTAGYALAAAEHPGEAAVGGLVGANHAACSLTVTDCFVSATATGNTADEIGLTVGADSGTVTASGNTVAVLIPQEDCDKTINIIAPNFIGSGNEYESKMLGDSFDGGTAITYANDDAYQAVTDYADRIAAYNSGAYRQLMYKGTAYATYADAYSEAYRQLIATAVKVDQSTSTELNQVKSESIIGNRGLLYPLTMTFSEETEFGTSVYDTSDTVEYPMGIDLNLTGNGSDKNTDLLFETTSDGDSSTTKIYRNIFKSNDASVAVKYDGETYENGEIYYDYSLPYAVAKQSVTVDGESIDIARKILYPVADIGGSVYPIATARQLKALTNPDESDNTKFAFLKTPVAGVGLDYQNRNIYLVNDIDMSATKFIPLASYSKTFYGNGHVISNMKIETSSGSAAMFTELSSGKIYDLGLMGMDVVNRGDNSSVMAAMLVARMYVSEINNCFAVGSVTATATPYEEASVGGLVGSAEDTDSAISNCSIVNCMVSGTVEVLTNNPRGDENDRGASAAGLVGHTTNDVTIQNAVVTTNVIGYNTYAISGSVRSGTRNLGVTNVVFGGQMENTADGGGVAARQHLTSAAGTTVTNVYADKDLGIELTGDNMLSTAVLAKADFITPAHFSSGGMVSFGDGYYPAPVSVGDSESDSLHSAFQAGAHFIAAAIHLNYIGSTDIVSSVSAPCDYGEEIGSARLSPDDHLGAYFKNDEESGNIVVNQDAMRLTQNNGGSYSAAPEVSGIVGTVSYSLNSPLSNSFLVRTVNDVKVRKTFTLSYVLRGDTDIGDKTVITVENVLDGSPMATTGLAQISSATNLTGTICENMLLQPTDNTYVLRAYADIGAGKTVESAKVQPAYVNNSGTVFSNLAVGGDVSDPTLSSFTAVSSTIGPDEDSGIRYTHLLITVTIQDIDEWGLQRTGWGVNFRR